MVERAASAANAGIEGYHADQAAVQDASRAPGNEPDAPIVDIWTFGAHEKSGQRSGDGEAHVADAKERGLWGRLKAALPKLRLNKRLAK